MGGGWVGWKEDQTGGYGDKAELGAMKEAMEDVKQNKTTKLDED